MSRIIVCKPYSDINAREKNSQIMHLDVPMSPVLKPLLICHEIDKARKKGRERTCLDLLGLFEDNDIRGELLGRAYPGHIPS